MKNHIGTAINFWKLAQAIATEDLEARYAMPVTLVVAGTDTEAAPIINTLITPRQGEATVLASHASKDIMRVERAELAPVGLPVIDASLVFSNPASLGEQLVEIVARYPDLRIGLAKRFPGIRAIVVDRFITDISIRNAKVAALSALPGVVPLGDFLLPFTSAGDMVALTRNQVELFLLVAACYGLPPDLKVRTREFAVTVGGAFLWRAAARQAIGWAPAGIGVAVKAAVAFAGTYAIGRAAERYFGAGGHRASSADIARFFQDGLKRLKMRFQGAAA